MGDRTDSQRLDDLEVELAKLAAENQQLRKRVRRATAIGAIAFALPFAGFALAHIVAIPIGSARATTLYADKIELRARSQATVLKPGMVDVLGDPADVMLMADNDIASVSVVSNRDLDSGTRSPAATLLADHHDTQLALESSDTTTDSIVRATIMVNPGSSGLSGFVGETNDVYFGNHHSKYSVTTSASELSELTMGTRDQGWKLGIGGQLVDSRTDKPIAPTVPPAN